MECMADDIVNAKTPSLKEDIKALLRSRLASALVS
jgi:hypothetical protein